MKKLADLTIESGPKVRLLRNHSGLPRELRTRRSLSNVEFARWLLYELQARRVPAELMAEIRRWSINEGYRAIKNEEKRYGQ